jgi:hypothetical protein
VESASATQALQNAARAATRAHAAPYCAATTRCPASCGGVNTWIKARLIAALRVGVAIFAPMRSVV